MNTNLLHNIINVLIILIAGFETMDLTPFLEPEIALKVTGGLAVAKLLINAIRDGVAGMTKEQPPVQ